MTSKKKNQSPTRVPPVQMRSGPELGQMLQEFAAQHNLQVNEACKCLVALAVTGLDRRFYELLKQLALGMGGANAFVRACVYVHTSLEGAGRLQGRPIQFDPPRAGFILQTVSDFLAARQLRVEKRGLESLPLEHVREGKPAPTFSRTPRRRVRPHLMDQLKETP
jgi:hypothetical protein